MGLRAAGFLFVLAAMVAPTTASGEGPPKPRPDPGFVSSSATAERIAGIWTSEADPGGAINISSYGGGGVSVTSHKRFEAMGFFDRDEFIGLTREPQGSDAPDGPFTYGILRLRRTGDATARAEFSSALGQPPTRTEVWRLEGRHGKRAPSTSVAASDSLPKFGEYVYVEELPEAIERVPPDYPTWARERGISGTVMVQALVGKDGRVKQTLVVKSIPELDDYAVAAVKQWRFKPASSKGEPVAVWVAVPVAFRLN